MKRLRVWGAMLLAASAVTTGGLAAGAAPAQASTSGCAGTLASAVIGGAAAFPLGENSSGTPVVLAAGDVLKLTTSAVASVPYATAGGMYVDHVLQATSGVPGTATYQIPASGSYIVGVGMNGTGASATVTCIPAPPPPVMSGFGQPVDMTVTNKAKAGSTIPFKFSVADGNGAPVVNLTSADISTATGAASACGSAPIDLIEQTVSGTLAGTLQNNGDGTYQYNWKTDKSWAGTCRSLGLTLAEGNTLTADFNLFK